MGIFHGLVHLLDVARDGYRYPVLAALIRAVRFGQAVVKMDFGRLGSELMDFDSFATGTCAFENRNLGFCGFYFASLFRRSSSLGGFTCHVVVS